VFASIAVYIHTSLALGTGFLALAMFFCFEQQKGQISSRERASLYI